MRPTFNLLLAIFAMILLTSMVSAMPTPETALSLTPSSSSSDPSITTIAPISAIDPITIATTANPKTALVPVVKLHLFTGAACKGIYRVLKMEPDTCYGLNGAQALRVIDFDKGLKYNALRVTRGEKCDQGWELQPLEGACSDVGVYGSIKVLVNTEW